MKVFGSKEEVRLRFRLRMAIAGLFGSQGQGEVCYVLGW